MLHLDFGVATSWQAQIHEAVDGLGRRVSDVDNTLVDAHLELFTAFFINVRAFDHSKGTLASRQWDWSGNCGTSTQCSVYNLFC